VSDTVISSRHPPEPGATVELIDATVGRCRAALDGEPFRTLRTWLASRDIGDSAAVTLVRDIGNSGRTQCAVSDLRSTILAQGFPLEDGMLERYLLLVAACDSLGRLESHPVSDEVKQLFCREYLRYVVEPAGRTGEFTTGHNRFGTACMLASLRRCPAGQFDWEVSGFPLSWLPQLPPASALRATVYLSIRMRGRAPLFYRHFGFRRPLIMTERAADASYYRMAESMRLQPRIRGMLSRGWFSSPQTHRISPHLGWANRTILENGGIVLEAGAADPSCGVLANSPERRDAFEAGSFTPALAVVLWEREAMLRWAVGRTP
jgi:hypothetical protein